MATENNIRNLVGWLERAGNVAQLAELVHGGQGTVVHLPDEAAQAPDVRRPPLCPTRSRPTTLQKMVCYVNIIIYTGISVADPVMSASFCRILIRSKRGGS